MKMFLEEKNNNSLSANVDKEKKRVLEKAL